MAPVDPDRQQAADWGLVEEGRDHVMRALGLVPVLLCVHRDAGAVLFQVADRLGILYGPCVVHGAVLTALALLDGRTVQLGHVQDADDLAAAIVDSSALDSLDADRLLADLKQARP
jgi:hypothetical protein